MIHFILGGARSGKSRFAEEQASAYQAALYYIATAQAGDDEMAERIAHHKKTRNGRWKTIEEPINIAGSIDKIVQHSNQNHQVCILVDCLTLWLSNLLCADLRDQDLSQMFHQLKKSLINASQSGCALLLVSNETGLGVIPQGKLTRRFVDTSGRLHQKIAEIADKVTMMIAGLPMQLKPAPNLQSQ